MIEGEEAAKLDSGHLAREDVGIPLDQLPGLPGRIMVVEDRDDIRLLVQELIETVGGEVVTASDGSEAVSMWIANRQGNRPVNAVLMDIQMPLMDGIEATRRLREEGFEGGIVALTAGVMEDDRQECLDAGCDEIVSKPIDPVELIHKLVPWIKRQLDDASGALSILSVEDHLDLASVQKTLLEARGHFVTVASNAEQAMEAVEHFAPDAVLMDLGLPGVSGADILLRMRDRPDLEGCTFICVSGRDESEVPWHDIGFDAFLRKPTSIDEIVQALTPR